MVPIVFASVSVAVCSAESSFSFLVHENDANRIAKTIRYFIGVGLVMMKNTKRIIIINDTTHLSTRRQQKQSAIKE
jgi:hypothetical protein